MQTTPKELKLKKSKLLTLKSQIKKLKANLHKHKDQVIKQAIDEVCEDYNITYEQIISPTRLRIISLPRQVAMYKLHQLGYSLMEIGKIFNKDHTTVIHAVRKIEQQKGRYPDIIL